MSIIEKSKNKIVEFLDKLFENDSAVNLVLYNDDYVYEGLVRQALMNTFGYSSSKAYDLMLTAHNYGSVIVWTGGRKEAENYAVNLRVLYGLTTEVVEL